MRACPKGSPRKTQRPDDLHAETEAKKTPQPTIFRLWGVLLGTNQNLL